MDRGTFSWVTWSKNERVRLCRKINSAQKCQKLMMITLRTWCWNGVGKNSEVDSRYHYYGTNCSTLRSWLLCGGTCFLNDNYSQKGGKWWNYLSWEEQHGAQHSSNTCPLALMMTELSWVTNLFEVLSFVVTISQNEIFLLEKLVYCKQTRVDFPPFHGFKIELGFLLAHHSQWSGGLHILAAQHIYYNGHVMRSCANQNKNGLAGSKSNTGEREFSAKNHALPALANICLSLSKSLWNLYIFLHLNNLNRAE